MPPCLAARPPYFWQSRHMDHPLLLWRVPHGCQQPLLLARAASCQCSSWLCSCRSTQLHHQAPALHVPCPSKPKTARPPASAHRIMCRHLLLWMIWPSQAWQLLLLCLLQAVSQGSCTLPPPLLPPLRRSLTSLEARPCWPPLRYLPRSTVTRPCWPLLRFPVEKSDAPPSWLLLQGRC